MIRKLLLRMAFIFPFVLNAQTCNLNFESGTLSGWTKTKGFNSNSLTMMGCCTNTNANAVYILNTPIVTNYGGLIPHSPFGGTKVVQVGDSLYTDYTTKITYTMIATNNSLQYAVAPVDLNPLGHTCNMQTYNAVLIKDNLGNIIHKNHMIPDTSSGGTCVPGGTVFTTWTNSHAYGCWSTYSVNIGAYIGQNISIEVISANCTGGAHWSYCYFDAACSVVTPTMLPCGISTGIENNFSSAEINIGPNPFSESFTISISDVNHHNFELEIYDITGKMIANKKDLQRTSNISLQYFNSGLYFYKILDDHKLVKTGKLIKE